MAVEVIFIPVIFKLVNVDEKDLYKNKSWEERKKIIPKMVKYAIKNGNKPAARKFNTYPSTVRRWVKEYKKNGKIF